MSSEAIEDNRQALKRIVAMLVETAGMAEPAGHRSKAGPRSTIARVLWQAILRVLRPAESAARRLIIATSLGMVAPVARLREARPKPKTMEPLLRRFGLAVMVSRDGPCLARKGKENAEDAAEASPRIPAFPLLDPPYRLNLYGRRRPTVPPHAAPRIMVPGITEPHRLPPPPSPGDRIAADGLVRRLAALAAVLDDLEAQARRFVRWKARRDALLARDPHIQRRVSPIRRGRPPGARYCDPDPAAIHPPRIREIDRILARAHAMALYALEKPDTS